MEIFLTEVQAEALRDMIGTVDALPIRLAIGDGHSGHGLYASLSEYPEEGADLIAALSSQPPAPNPKEDMLSQPDLYEVLRGSGYLTSNQASELAYTILRRASLTGTTSTQEQA